MRIDSLELFSFRNYAHIRADFDPSVNLIAGDNAQGKTNLLEAITYLSTGRSFRTRKEAELICFDADFAELNCKVTSKDREQTLRAVLFAGRRQRQLYVSGVRKKTAAELSGILTTVLFCPEDLLILKTGAAARRKFLDAALCQMRPNYEKALSEYQRLHEQKSRILKDRLEQPSLLEVLPDFNRRMAQVGAIIISYRAKFLQLLAQAAGAFHDECSGGREKMTMVYKTVSTVTDPLAPPETIFDQLVAHQNSHYRAELESQQCLSGPHKDDFDVFLDEKPLRAFGSQGQTRTAAIALKLAEREILRRDTGEEPVLLLDDVLSELDAGRRDFVLNKIQTGQVFITCCEENAIPDSGRVLRIHKGSILEATP